MAASSVVYGSPALGIPAGQGPSNLIVIDWVNVSSTSASAGDMTVTINGSNFTIWNVARVAAAAATTGSIILDFGGGFPVWGGNTGEDSVVGTGVFLGIAHTGGSGGQISCGFHYENPGARRSAGTGYRGGG